LLNYIKLWKICFISLSFSLSFLLYIYLLLFEETRFAVRGTGFAEESSKSFG
jgi:hypothetical protein